jgi:hypothetical protein
MRLITRAVPVVVTAGALGLAACSGSSPSGTSWAKYYQEGYRYARANISQAQYQILSHVGYAKWCASATAATNALGNAQAGSHSKAASRWVQGCNAYAASVRLPANASPATARPAAQPPPPTQAPTQTPTSPTNSNPQPSAPAPSPSQPPQQTASVPAGMYAWPGGGYCNIPFNEQYYQQNGVPGVCQPTGSKNMP